MTLVAIVNLKALSMEQNSINHRRKQHTFVLSGNGSYSNRGCEAIVRGTTALLREQVGECRFISNYFPAQGCIDAQREIDSGIVHHPFPLLKRYSLPWIEEQIARKLLGQPYNVRQVSQTFLRLLPDADAVLMLGGDTFNLDASNPRIHFRLSQLAVEHGLPVAIWGASVGPFARDPNFERWAAPRLRRVSLICARETETVEYLAGIGVKENVVLSADPAFHLQPAACELPADIEQVLADGCIGLNLSPLLQRFIHVSSEQQGLSAWAEVATEVVDGIIQHISQPILLIPHVTSEVGENGRDDYLFLRRVAERVGKPERVFVLEPHLDAAQTKWVIGQLRVFAGARTHSTLAAISSCVPTICIGYSIKARGIAKDVYGHLDWHIPSQRLVEEPSVLRERLISLCDREREMRSRLESMKPRFLQRARDAIQRFVDIVG